jgi:hypothetical protein
MFELIHTSAPRGLFGGSGYTTVAATQGMPDALRKVLESLSGYEQVFEYGSPQFHSNPEAYICQPIGQAAGKSWWVISRIVVADKDYTGRSNYLAHHVALDNNELPHAGPAALARTFPWMSSWAGEPRMLPVRSMPSIAAPAPPMAAPAWTRAGLDAGWAGHLAEQARSRRGIIQLVYPQTVDPLALIADAVALLPPAERWDARFHTHTSRPRPDQAWAWFPAEAGATPDLARRPGVVYLAMRPPCPSTGPLVDQARGKIASIPAMGGAGNLNFHGSHGNAGLPVATAVATSTDPYAPAGRGAAGSWGAPPVPKKGSLVGPILHWTAHGLMVVVMLVLIFLLLMRTNGKSRKDLAVPIVEGNGKNLVAEPKKGVQEIGVPDKDEKKIDFPKLPEVIEKKEPAAVIPEKKVESPPLPVVAKDSKMGPEPKTIQPIEPTKPAAPILLPEFKIEMLENEIPAINEYKVSSATLNQLKPSFTYSSKNLQKLDPKNGGTMTIRFLTDEKQKKLIDIVAKMNITQSVKDRSIRSILTLGIEQEETKSFKPQTSISNTLQNYFEVVDDQKKPSPPIMDTLIYPVISEKIRSNKSTLADSIDGWIRKYNDVANGVSKQDKDKGAARLSKAEKFKAEHKEFISALEGWNTK